MLEVSTCGPGGGGRYQAVGPLAGITLPPSTADGRYADDGFTRSRRYDRGNFSSGAAGVLQSELRGCAPAADSAEKLRGDLASCRFRLDTSEGDRKVAERRAEVLVQEVAGLEAEKRALGQEADVFQSRCFTLEQECAQLTDHGDYLQSELNASREREKSLAQRCIECQLSAGQADNAELHAQAKAKGYLHVVKVLESEVERLRTAARDTERYSHRPPPPAKAPYERGDAVLWTVPAPLAEPAFLRSLRDARDRNTRLEKRVLHLEAALAEREEREAELNGEVVALRTSKAKDKELTRRLRISLQDAITEGTRFREAPHYNAELELRSPGRPVPPPPKPPSSAADLGTPSPAPLAPVAPTAPPAQARTGFSRTSRSTRVRFLDAREQDMDAADSLAVI